MSLFKIPKKSKEEKLAQLSPAQRRQLEELEAEAIAEYKGELPELESALGMLRLGHHVGWKVLYIIHSKRTIRKYEEILGIKVRDIFPETGPSSYRNYGYRIVEGVTNFWKRISGEEPIPDKRKMAP
jgi:hypothetical protein